MTLQVFSAPLGFDDPDILILSRKFNKKVELEGYMGGHRGIGAYLAPSSALQARRHKRCRFILENEFPEEWELYVEEYKAEMRTSYREHRLAWEMLLGWERVVLVCSAKTPERAVRTLLGREILGKLGAEFRGELDYQLPGNS